MMEEKKISTLLQRVAHRFRKPSKSAKKCQRYWISNPSVFRVVFSCQAAVVGDICIWTSRRSKSYCTCAISKRFLLSNFSFFSLTYLSWFLWLKNAELCRYWYLVFLYDSRTRGIRVTLLSLRNMMSMCICKDDHISSLVPSHSTLLSAIIVSYQTFPSITAGVTVVKLEQWMSKPRERDEFTSLRGSIIKVTCCRFKVEGQIISSDRSKWK